ncbi:MAG: uL22 family ribosomal protein [Candidatus Aenigmatarchaeota archaeon]
MAKAGYSMQVNPKTSSKAFGRALRISTRNAIAICTAINGMNLQKAKAMMRNVLEGKASLDGKFYNNATQEILSLLESAEANAKAKELDTNKLIIKVSATKGFTFHRPRTRRKLSGQQGKMTNVQVILRKA